MDAPAIEVSDLEHRYEGRPAVSVPHLAIPRGTTLTLLGPNGSGKSTLMRLMALLERPSRGTVAFNGTVPATARERLRQRRRMTMVFQDPLLFAGTVQRNVAYGPRLRGLTAAAVDALCDRALRLLGIEDFKHRRADTLSGGEAQKVALARCLATEPEVLFLDEPTAYLDAPAKQAFLKELRDLLSGLGLTAVFVTHDRSEALALGGRIAVLEAGHLRQVGVAERVLRQPATLSVASFLGAKWAGKGFINASAAGKTVAVNGLSFPLGRREHPPGPVDLILRPEDIRLHPDEPTAGVNSLKGRVIAITPEGQVYRVTVKGALEVSGFLTAHAIRSWSLATGSELYASFYPDSLHLLPAQGSD